MRALIYFENPPFRDAFESIRMRKTLKGECERGDIPWVDPTETNPDIAHFISYKDILVLQRFSLNKAKIVVSALYCEHEINDSYLTFDRLGKLSLRPTAKVFLNQADLVLVPTLSCLKLLAEAGVKAPIKVAPPCVNVERFNLQNLESALFLRYFGVSPERKYVLITGNFKERKKIKLVRGLAKALPKLRFYFFGSASTAEEPLIRHYKNKATDNLKFSRIVSDDVYRSAMLHASAYLVLDCIPDGLSTIEAFAAKTPVIALGDQPYNPMLINGITATMCNREGELIDSLRDVLEGKEFQTIVPAYAVAKRNSLERGAIMLKDDYQSLLNKK